MVIRRLISQGSQSSTTHTHTPPSLPLRRPTPSGTSSVHSTQSPCWLTPHPSTTTLPRRLAYLPTYLFFHPLALFCFLLSLPLSTSLRNSLSYPFHPLTIVLPYSFTTRGFWPTRALTGIRTLQRTDLTSQLTNPLPSYNSHPRNLTLLQSPPQTFLDCTVCGLKNHPNPRSTPTLATTWRRLLGEAHTNEIWMTKQLPVDCTLPLPSMTLRHRSPIHFSGH